MNIPEKLEQWVGAQLIDRMTADRILQFEQESGKGGLRWPAVLAVVFGSLMLCAGILLFVAAHWDELSPGQRFGLVLAMVAIFHLVASLLGSKVPSVGVALHLAGSTCLGAGIYLAGQIFNLEEHWPGGIMLWALGAALAWVVLRQWPQALLAAVLIPWWLGGEWSLATEGYQGTPWNIAAQGFLLLSIFYLSASPQGPNRALKLGMVWVGGLSLIPFIGDVVFTGDYAGYIWPPRPEALPTSLKLMGYAASYLPVLLMAWMLRKQRSLPIFAAAIWVGLLGVFSRQEHPEHNPWIYLWIGLGACAFCYWGVREHRRVFINFGTAIFALDVVTFYFSDVLDKLGRSMGLILLGVIFLAGGWVLNRLRSDLIARAAASAGGMQ